MNQLEHIVAIDGPAGTGKSTVAKRVAKLLKYAYLDTGAMYRAATWWAFDQGVDTEDAEALAESTRTILLEIKETDGAQHVKVDGRDISEAIRTPEITREIYKVAENVGVREHLVELQRQFALLNGPTVAEGRDMCTTVFPFSKCKIFLDASLDERTERRARDLKAKGIEVDIEELRREIKEREEKNRTREVSPLEQAEDATLLDTSDMTIDEVVETVAGLARKVFDNGEISD